MDMCISVYMSKEVEMLVSDQPRTTRPIRFLGRSRAIKEKKREKTEKEGEDGERGRRRRERRERKEKAGASLRPAGAGRDEGGMERQQ